MKTQSRPSNRRESLNKLQTGSGRISKPQKSKKHKKLKAANALIDDKDIKVKRTLVDRKLINQKPNNADEQEVPRSIRDISKWKDKLKQGYKRKKKKKRSDFQDSKMKVREKGMTRALKPVPDFKKKKGESEDAFMNRVERETQAVIQRSRFEDKYKVDLTQSKYRSSSEGPEWKKKGKRKKKQLKRLKEKKEVKAKKQMERKSKNNDDFGKFKDEVAFGEVAMEPPILSAKPRKAEASSDKARPGKKDLLLTNLMKQGQEKQRPLGKTVKRKDLSMAQRRILDAERDRAIQMYRQSKQNT